MLVLVYQTGDLGYVRRCEPQGRVPAPIFTEGQMAAIDIARPGLVFFYSARSGACRRTEGFLAQVLQRRRNHGTFNLYRVAEEERPDLVERFRVDELPTLLVVEEKSVAARLERPKGCREIERFLAPWLH